MRIAPATGEVYIGGVHLVAGMRPDVVLCEPPLRPNSSLGGTQWFWAPDLDGSKLIGAKFHPLGDVAGSKKAPLDASLVAELGPAHRSKTKRTPWPWSPTQYLERTWKFEWGTVVCQIEGRDLQTEVSVSWSKP